MSDLPILPFDDDSFDPAAPQKPGQAVLGLDFAYIGQALLVSDFVTYLQNYNFGSIPPDTIVLHHTAVPTLAQWTANEAGLSEPRIRAKRLAKLAGLRDFYAAKGWSAGPHLFVCDRYIYLFTPMNQVGIHAKWGNSFRAMGRLHYSIGIEIIGDYSNQVWPTAVARNVHGAVIALQARLGTFNLHYLYSDPASKPGLIGSGDKQACAHPERLRYGGIASHRDFNKIACPGAAITEAYYMGVLTAGESSVSSQKSAVPPIAHYRVAAACTGGATIRAAPRQTGAVLGRLHAGDEWEGVEVAAQSATFVTSFGSSRVWIQSSDMRYVWSGLLEKVRES